MPENPDFDFLPDQATTDVNFWRAFPGIDRNGIYVTSQVGTDELAHQQMELLADSLSLVFGQRIEARTLSDGQNSGWIIGFFK